MSMGLEIGGVSLATLGWVGCILSCGLPIWKTTAFIGYNIVTAQFTWEGLWMDCVVQSTGQMQCKVYDSMLLLSQDIQAARAMVVISIVLGVLGILIFLMGAQCTRCMEDEVTKSKITIVSGVIFLLAGFMILIPVSWTANTIIRNFYNPIVPESRKWELGASLYIGWAGAALLFFGGALLCCSCPPKQDRYRPTNIVYSAPKSTIASYDKKNYV
ncbi:claudin-3-like [Tiliqua scincoides]|uniref:claudin-3-like n=1 Tax=Tiliqua scincoides TaxID=71010 RepID=UPI0034631B7D